MELSVKYTFSLEESEALLRSWLYSTRPWLKPVRWRLIAVSLSLAVLYAVTNPPESLFNGEPSRLGSLLIALLVQVPLLTVMLFYGVRWLWTSVERGVCQTVRAMPESHWGWRSLRIDARGLHVEFSGHSTSWEFQYVTNVRETPDGFFFERQRTLVFALPKKALSPEQADLLRGLRV